MRKGTQLIRAGRQKSLDTGFVNPPICRGSTVLAPNLAAWERLKQAQCADVPRSSVYGRFGSESHHTLQDAVAQLEEGYASLLYPSGLAAISTVLLSLLSAGDHVLVSDCAYNPTIGLLQGTLARYGVRCDVYPPDATPEVIESLIRPETRVLYIESPGSDTLEIQDVPALAQVARRHGVRVVMDNTWATPLFFKPLLHGVDISIQSATKYITGHSDTLLGIAISNRECWSRLRDTTFELGQTAGPEEVYLALRGLRTLELRLRQHWSSSVKVANWLEQRPEVSAVFHPALASHPNHALWKRDFTGASGLFSIQLHPLEAPALAAFVDHLELFGLGLSWGGYESLALPVQPPRLLGRPGADGQWIRIHVGLEDPDDLIADLESGFAHLQAAQAAEGLSVTAGA